MRSLPNEGQRGRFQDRFQIDVMVSSKLTLDCPFADFVCMGIRYMGIYFEKKCFGNSLILTIRWFKVPQSDLRIILQVKWVTLMCVSLRPNGKLLLLAYGAPYIHCPDAFLPSKHV